MKSNKMKICYVIVICTLLVGLFVLFNSYAYWRVKGGQSGSNIVKGACINIEIEEETDGESGILDGVPITNAYPLTDEQGANLNGYTFTIVNNCDVDTKYEVDLESLKIDGISNGDYLDNQYIKMQIDDGMIRRYSELDDTDDDPNATDPDNIRETKYIFSGTVPGKQGDEPGKESHTIKLWIASDATTNNSQNKQFKSRINVIAGQNIITGPSYKVAGANCFSVNDDGIISGRLLGNADEFYSNCGTDIVIPPIIDGKLVTETYFGTGMINDFGERLTSLDISGMYGLKKINIQAFWRYNGENNPLVLPSNLEIIGESAFYNFKGTNISFPNSLKEIGWSAFREYNGAEIILPDSITKIDDYAFSKYEGIDTILKLPNDTEYIGYMTFYYFKGNDIVFPKKLATIEKSAFESYNGNSLSLPDGLVSIGTRAFGSYNNSDVVIPSTVEVIGQNAFRALDSSKTVYVNRPNLSGITFDGENANTSWHGSAQVKCLISENHYDDCPSN